MDLVSFIMGVYGGIKDENGKNTGKLWKNEGTIQKLIKNRVYKEEHVFMWR